jgi:DNA-binding MarR family transcriptional regulator
MTTEIDPGVEAALDRLNVSFRTTMAAVRRLKGRETQRPGELSFAQFSLLFGLAEAESGELSSRELACRAELSPATVTQMLDSLEAHGLVRRARSATDKRVVLTSLTDRGQQRVDERRAQYEPRWREAMSRFDAGELRAATAVLDALTQLFNEFADEQQP